VSSEAGTFQRTPVIGGAVVGLGLALAIAMFDPVFEGDEPTVGLAVWGKHAAAEVDPVEAVVQPALQGVHAESPAVPAKLPMGHAVHAELPENAAKLPMGHAVQLAEPDPLVNCPLGQGKQFVVAKFQPGR
jgi:hypothetical protein